MFKILIHFKSTHIGSVFFHKYVILAYKNKYIKWVLPKKYKGLHTCFMVCIHVLGVALKENLRYFKNFQKVTICQKT